MKTQGQLSKVRTVTAQVVAPYARPRRSVILGSLGSLVVGLVLSSTALPALATSMILQPSATLSHGTTGLKVRPVAASSSTTVVSPTTVVIPTTVSTRPVPTHTAAVTHGATTRRSAVNQVRVGSTSVTNPPVVKAPTTPPTVTTVPRSPVSTTVAAPVVQASVVKVSVKLKLSANIAPVPNFLSSGTGSIVNGVLTYQNPCVTPQSTWPVFTNDVACTNYVLAAINNARTIEGVAPMVLPTNWYTLTTAQQLFVVADLERVDRGLAPYVGLNSALSAEAQHAAQTNSDPGIASGFPIANNAQGIPGMGGAWSGGYDVLTADYVWMYDDGWGGSKAATSNIVCTSTAAAGCWAHREELLGSDPGYNPGVGLTCANCEMGTGFAIVNGHASYVDLIEIPKGALPPMTFTWAKNVLPFLG